MVSTTIIWSSPVPGGVGQSIGSNRTPPRLEHLGGTRAPIVGRDGMPRGEFAPSSASTGFGEHRGGPGTDETGRSVMDMIEWFVGVDWGSEAHRSASVVKHATLTPQNYAISIGYSAARRPTTAPNNTPWGRRTR